MEYNKEYFKSLLPKRPRNSHKGTFGHVLNISGSASYSGAAYLSSLAPLVTGCGLVTLANIEEVIKAVAALTPNIIFLNLTSGKYKTVSKKSFAEVEKSLDKYDVISIGCGLGVNEDTIQFFERLINCLRHTKKNIIIDADGLNILSQIKNLHMPQNITLTPHPKELSRLMETTVDIILSRSEHWAKKCSEKFNCTTVLKLHETIVSDKNGNVRINYTGNSALAHGGSGDVLCGMIAGFLAQGMQAFEACCLAVYLHGLAGELASKDLGEHSVLASDLLNYIPKSIKTIL